MSGKKCFLFKVGLALTTACCFCGEMDESLVHLISCCHYSKNFWAEVIKWLNKEGIKITNISDKNIMFGIVGCNGELFGSHVLLVTKQCLYYHSI